MVTDFKLILEILIGIISLTGFIGSALLYRDARVKKSYAAERDFGHIKNSLQQQNSNLEELYEQLDNTHDDLKEVKAIVLSFSQRLDSILTRLEIQSNVFGRRNKENE